MISTRSFSALLLCLVLPASQIAGQTSPPQQLNPAALLKQELARASQLLHSAVLEDQQAAFRMFAEAGRSGSIRGGEMAAWMLMNGVGYPRDPKTAASWLQWLVQQNDA